jgi:LEA14-like dessication related protein
MRRYFRVPKSRGRKWLLVVAIILAVCAVVLAAVLGTRSCREWLANKAATADVNIVGISFKGISLTAVTVDVTVSVYNSNPVGAVLHRIAYIIYFEEDGSWVQLGSADRTEEVTIKASSSTTFDIMNQIGLLPAAAALYEIYNQGGSVNMKVAGSAWVGIGPVSVKVPFERIEKIGF